MVQPLLVINSSFILKSSHEVFFIPIINENPKLKNLIKLLKWYNLLKKTQNVSDGLLSTKLQGIYDLKYLESGNPDMTEYIL